MTMGKNKPFIWPKKSPTCASSKMNRARPIVNFGCGGRSHRGFAIHALCRHPQGTAAFVRLCRRPGYGRAAGRALCRTIARARRPNPDRSVRRAHAGRDQQRWAGDDLVGKVNVKIPAWQRVLQRFLMTRPVTAFVAPILHHVDAFFLRLSGGRLDITRLSGLPVVELTTIGAKSGLPRTLPLAGFPDGDKFVLIASNYGRARLSRLVSQPQGQPGVCCQEEWARRNVYRP